jgi:hypothetical protein
MTADIVAALELTKNDAQYNIRYSWSEHPEYSDFMLTSLITTNETICYHPRLVHQMVRGIARAIKQVRMRRSLLANEFAAIFGQGLPISTQVLDRLAQDSIYPESTVPTISSWRNAYEIYAKLQRLSGGNDRAIIEYSALVRPEYARKVELEIMEENAEMQRRAVEFEDRIRSMEAAISKVVATEGKTAKLDERLDAFVRVFIRCIYTCVNVFLVLMLGAILHWTSQKYLWTTPREVWLGFVVGILYVVALLYCGKRLKAIQSWRMFQRLCKTWEKFWWGALVTLAIAVAWDFFKAKYHLFLF